MNEKGFTLVELLAAIAILGIVSLIAFPIVNDTIKNQKNKLYDRQIATIEDAAKSLTSRNTLLLPENNSVSYLSINYLVKKGTLDETKISDPRSSKELEGCVKITFNSTYNQYMYEFIDIAEVNDNLCSTALNEGSDEPKGGYCILDQTAGTSNCNS